MPKSERQEIQQIWDLIADLTRDVDAIHAAIEKLARGRSPRDPRQSRLSTPFPQQRKTCLLRQPRREL
jgi:hypothetical protein